MPGPRSVQASEYTSCKEKTLAQAPSLAQAQSYLLPPRSQQSLPPPVKGTWLLSS